MSHTFFACLVQSADLVSMHSLRPRGAVGASVSFLIQGSAVEYGLISTKNTFGEVHSRVFSEQAVLVACFTEQVVLGRILTLHELMHRVKLCL